MARLSAFFCAIAAILHTVSGTTAFARGDAFVDTLPPSQGFVQVYGAVGRAGAILLRSPTVSAAKAVEAAGGVTSDAYLLGTVLLRRTVARVEQRSRVCTGLPELQAMQSLRTSVPAFVAQEIGGEVGTGRRFRVPVKLDAALLSGAAVADVALIDGDVLIIPPRPAYVQVISAEARSDVVLYQPGQLAEAYFSAAGYPRRGAFESDWMVLPDGTIRELRLRFWNYQPTAVPPGSALVTGVGSPQACVSVRGDLGG